MLSFQAFVPRIDSAFLLPDTEGPEVFGDRSIEMGVRPTGNTLPGSGLPVVKGNKDNDGMLLVGGQPFWASTIAPVSVFEAFIVFLGLFIVRDSRSKSPINSLCTRDPVATVVCYEGSSHLKVKRILRIEMLLALFGFDTKPPWHCFVRS